MSQNRERERELIEQLIRSVAESCPRRQATSEAERRAQEIVGRQFDSRGIRTWTHAFEFNDSIHANLALHFGLATLGTLVSGWAPRTAFALHAGSTASYWAESTRRGYVLRRLFPFKPSQNLVAVLPAKAEPRLRLVFIAHADAAFTGTVFHPDVLRRARQPMPRGLEALERPIALATRAQTALAGIDLIRSIVGPLSWPLRPIELLLTLPSAMILLINIEILLRDEIVPGANDDLTGVACLPVLADRLAEHKPDDVELVFVVSGAEEAGLGGADALARDMDGIWNKRRTVVIALDTLSLGELVYLDPEGEVTKAPVPARLSRTIDEVAASEPRFGSVRPYQPPLGGTDAAAFLAHGYEAVGLTCIDPELGAAGNYHRLTDTPEALDFDQVLLALDFAEHLALRLIDERASD